MCILIFPSFLPRYFGACCLNQMVIGPHDEALAAKLIEIYFTFFKVIILSTVFFYYLLKCVGHYLRCGPGTRLGTTCTCCGLVIAL